MDIPQHLLYISSVLQKVRDTIPKTTLMESGFCDFDFHGWDLEHMADEHPMRFVGIPPQCPAAGLTASTSLTDNGDTLLEAADTGLPLIWLGLNHLLLMVLPENCHLLIALWHSPLPSPRLHHPFVFLPTSLQRSYCLPLSRPHHLFLILPLLQNIKATPQPLPSPTNQAPILPLPKGPSPPPTSHWGQSIKCRRYLPCVTLPRLHSTSVKFRLHQQPL